MGVSPGVAKAPGVFVVFPRLLGWGFLAVTGVRDWCGADERLTCGLVDCIMNNVPPTARLGSPPPSGLGESSASVSANAGCLTDGRTDGRTATFGVFGRRRRCGDDGEDRDLVEVSRILFLGRTVESLG